MKIKFEFSSEIFGPSYNMQISWKLFLLQGVYAPNMRSSLDELSFKMKHAAFQDALTAFSK